MKRLLITALLLVCGAAALKAQDAIYVDPIYNGSTDPMVCYNPVTDSYYMYYTSRRSNVPGLGGIESVHGSPIGIAESVDGGTTWKYIGDCNIDYHPDPNPTYWAPEVICVDGTFHMYLTYVPGIFDTWEYPRDIVHLTSKDGRNWTTQSVLDLAVRKVIDACIFQLPDGTWRLWYNNEPDGKTIFYADSKDLYHWTDKGKVTSIVTNGEGPNVIFWKGKYYMIVDEWKGLSVFSSDDATNWVKQEGDYLVSGLNGQRRGNHADIEVVDGHAYMFYFGNIPPKEDPRTGSFTRRRGYAVYVVELQMDENGRVFCDTTAPCRVRLR
ncbi:MAG: family 43 glycosylhydrolase [Bacteroidales bacterium]|nr:family 43 glycosylhydrolase [Bacteroidales bacterium]